VCLLTNPALFSEGEDRMTPDDSSLTLQKVKYPNYQRLKINEEGKLIWEEYKYRHDLVWKHLIRSTVVLVALVTIRYSKDFNLDPASSFVTFAWGAALVYWFITVVVIEPELGLLARVRNLHRERQNYCFGLVNRITPIEGELGGGRIFLIDAFAQRVGFYLFLLLVGTAFAIPEELLR
jgi:hypothetical protein